MAQYVALRPDVEVFGQSMLGFVDSTGRYAPLIKKILVKHGMHRLGPDDWFPMQPWLDTHREIVETIGESTLFVIGRKIPDLAPWPAGIDTIAAALASLDVAYHFNHRIQGEVLYDPETGLMREGIGHYRYQPDGPRSAVMVCDNPYSSEFDRGIITGLARRLEPAVEVTLDTSRPTRKRGADACTYLVKW